ERGGGSQWPDRSGPGAGREFRGHTAGDAAGYATAAGWRDGKLTGRAARLRGGGDEGSSAAGRVSRGCQQVRPGELVDPHPEGGRDEMRAKSGPLSLALSPC